MCCPKTLWEVCYINFNDVILFTEFRGERTSTSDTEFSGYPTKVAIISEEIVKTDKEMMADWKLKVPKIVEAHCSVISSRNDYLILRKLSERWIPHLVTNGQKSNNVTTLEESLALLKRTGFGAVL